MSRCYDRAPCSLDVLVCPLVFSLGELDPDLSGSRIIVADRADGKPLDGEHGPFRIVAPQDTRGARSIRMLQRLEIVRLRK
ncbi:MAG TPA: hypothetical protein VG736_10000 [Vicinamibacterales bacterium]|nr:hypothetical protein [Vicinamibacterales bacterium]